MKKFATAAFAAIMGITGISVAPMTAVAAPVVPLIQQGETANNAIQVQFDRRWDRRHIRRWDRRIDRRWDRRVIRRHGDFRRSGFYVRNGNGWYNGHRGYRSYRHGYRRHNDFWFPAGAFIAGAIIGGALSNPGPTYYQPRRVYRQSYGSAHVRWCYNRYRSYDAYSNTYQPYNGPRRACYSPYS